MNVADHYYTLSRIGPTLNAELMAAAMILVCGQIYLEKLGYFRSLERSDSCFL